MKAESMWRTELLRRATRYKPPKQPVFLRLSRLGKEMRMQRKSFAVTEVGWKREVVEVDFFFPKISANLQGSC